MAEKEKDVREKTPKPDEKFTKQSPLFEKLWFLAGIPAAVVFAALVQYLYHNYYVLPLKERTLLEPISFDVDRKSWFVPGGPLFALRSRHPDSLYFGIAWKKDETEEWQTDRSTFSSIHFEEGDGASFGHMKISDHEFGLSVKFVSIGEVWTVRVKSVRHTDTSKDQLAFYLKSGKPINLSADDGPVFAGSNNLLGNFSVSFDTFAYDGKFSTHVAKDWKSLFAVKNDKLGSFAALSAVVEKDFEVEFSLSTEDSKAVSGPDFEDLYNMSKHDWEKKFEKGYALQQQNLPAFYQSMGRIALSSVLFSQRYFFGTLSFKGHLNSEFQMKNQELIYIDQGNEEQVTIDDMVFALMTIKNYDTDGKIATQVLTSWLNRITELGQNPSVISENGVIALNDKKSNIRIFYLINQLLEENKISVSPKLSERLADVLIDNLSFIPKNLSLSTLCDMSFALKVIDRLPIEMVDKKWAERKVSKKSIDNWREVTSFENIIKNFWNAEKKTFEHEANELEIVSLYPLMYQIIPHTSEELRILLEALESTKLWTTMGVASSAEGKMGVAWNALIIESLKHYSQKSSESQALAHVLYSKLRNNVIGAVAREFKRSGVLPSTLDSEGNAITTDGNLDSAMILSILAA